MGINLREEGARMQAEIGGAELGLGVVSATRRFDVRAYRVTNPNLVNKTVAQIEALPVDIRVFIARIRHDGQIIEPTPTTVFTRMTSSRSSPVRRCMWSAVHRIGPEVDDKALLDIPIETLDVVVTQRSVVGKTLAELARLEVARGVFLRISLGPGRRSQLAPVPASIGATCCA